MEARPRASGVDGGTEVVPRAGRSTWLLVALLTALLLAAVVVASTNGLASVRNDGGTARTFSMGQGSEVVLIALSVLAVTLTVDARFLRTRVRWVVPGAVGVGAAVIAIAGLRAIAGANGVSSAAVRTSSTTYTAAFALAMLLQLGACAVAVVVAVRSSSDDREA